MDPDLQQGAKVLIGDANWKSASFWTALRVLLGGRRERFEHLGVIATIRWWRGAPYLTVIRKART